MINVTLTDFPDASKGISHTIASRPPLRPLFFAKLPLGSIKPGGWIKGQLDLMRVGMVGRLKELSHFLADNNGWLGGDDDGWEEQPYWLRGFYNLGVLTDDQKILAESKRWIEAVIASAQEDGYFGPRCMKSVAGKDGSSFPDIWGHMVMIDALRSYWEVNKDQRIIDLLTAFFQYCRKIPEDQFIPPRTKHPDFGTWRPFIQWTRAGDMLPHIYWLHAITGDDWLLEVATRFHNHEEPPGSKWLNAHVVHFTERFRYPGNYYLQSNDPKDIADTDRWYDTHMAEWGQQPGGLFAADENLRPGKNDPKQATETCAMAEFNKSFYILGQITGEAKYADRVEDIIFNSFPVSQTPDLKGLHYLTAANQPQLDASGEHDYFNKGRQIDYSPSEIYRCCQHNVAMGWPYYAEHLWMAAAGDGVAAWMYGPCEVTATVADGVEVKILEETDYPFHTDVKLTLSAPCPVSFPLYLRVPGWCDDFGVKVNGEEAPISGNGRFAKIDREWKDGDIVEISMPVHWSVTKWEKSCGSVTVNRGPLSFSLKIGEDWRKQATGTDTWPDWEVFPTTPWNYGLIFDEDDLEGSFRISKTRPVESQPWTLESAPVEAKAKGKRIPNWKLIDECITDLQPGPIRSDEPEEEITLIPMGCARLRICCFPVISDGPDAKEWKTVSSHDEALRLRLGGEPEPIE